MMPDCFSFSTVQSWNSIPEPSHFASLLSVLSMFAPHSCPSPSFQQRKLPSSIDRLISRTSMPWRYVRIVFIYLCVEFLPTQRKSVQQKPETYVHSSPYPHAQFLTGSEQEEKNTILLQADLVLFKLWLLDIARLFFDIGDK